MRRRAIRPHVRLGSSIIVQPHPRQSKAARTGFPRLARALFLVLAFSLLLGGCGLRRPKNPTTALPLQPRAASTLLAALKERALALRDLRAEAKLSLKLRDKRYKANQAILIKIPTMLRFETLGVFGQSMFLFSSDSRQLRIFYPKERKFYIAEATSKNLYRMLGMQLPISVLTYLASGAVPLPSVIREPEVRVLASQRVEVLSFNTLDGGRQHVWFKAGANDPTRMLIYDAKGSLILMAAFANYDDEAGFRFPHTIEIVVPQDSAVLKIRYHDIEFNVGLEQAAFALPTPPGVEVIDLDKVS